MTALLLALALAGHPPPPCEGHVAPRDWYAKKAFMEAHPWPGGPEKGSIRHCFGYVVDHICPLVCCGLDAPQNMQWQTEEAAKAKDKVGAGLLDLPPGIIHGERWAQAVTGRCSECGCNREQAERERKRLALTHPYLQVKAVVCTPVCGRARKRRKDSKRKRAARR